MGDLDGLISFYSWHHALRAEKVLGRSGYRVELIPAPRDFSPNCGTALRFEYDRRQEALEALASARVRIDATHRFVLDEEGAADEDLEEHPAGLGPRGGSEGDR